MVDFIEQVHLGLISPRPYRTGGRLLDNSPGLCSACPGLLSDLPTGERPLPVSSIAGWLRRWRTDTEDIGSAAAFPSRIPA